MDLDRGLIRQTRKKIKINQQDMADALGLSKRTYEKLENGQLDITLPMMDKIAEHLNLSVFDLLKFEDKQTFNNHNHTTGNFNNYVNSDVQTNLPEEIKNLYEKYITDLKIQIQELKSDCLFLRKQLENNLKK